MTVNASMSHLKLPRYLFLVPSAWAKFSISRVYSNILPSWHSRKMLKMSSLSSVCLADTVNVANMAAVSSLLRNTCASIKSLFPSPGASGKCILFQMLPALLTQLLNCHNSFRCVRLPFSRTNKTLQQYPLLYCKDPVSLSILKKKSSKGFWGKENSGLSLVLLQLIIKERISLQTRQ